MKKIRDTIHGFGFYTYYDIKELDLMFQKKIFDFLKNKYAKIEFPLSTDDLTSLVETGVKDLDIYASLEENVEGETIFLKGKKPSVRISEKLSNDSKQENRFRMTLAHEYGHVILHNYIIQKKSKFEQKCRRENIDVATKIDWMEWQAFYAGGALLMPIAELKKALYHANSIADKEESAISIVADKFKVSQSATAVRLKQSNLI